MRPARQGAWTLPLLYRDEHYVAVNKPAGLLVHRSRIAAEEEDAVLQRLRNQLRQRVYPVHRLDRPTAGVLVMGLSPEAAGRLGQGFQDRGVDKRYHAVVRGWAPETLVVDHPVKTERGTTRQEARTSLRRLATVELPYPVGRYASARYSLIEARPHTGRLHQIRQHCKHISHHIIGDTSHGDGRHNQFFRDQLHCDALLLFASALQFSHPYTGETLTLRAPLPEPVRALFAALGWSEWLEEDGCVRLVD